VSAEGGVHPELPQEPTNTFAVASHLLDHWCARPGGFAVLDLDDSEFSAWSDLVADVESQFDRCDGTLDADDLRWIDSTRGRVADDHLWAQAVAWGLDLSTWSTFTALWHASIGSVASYRPQAGELYPVGDWLPDPPAGLRRSVRPSAESTYRDELPHLRRWDDAIATGSDAVSVEFYFDAEAEVRASAEAATVASIHANGNDGEFKMTGTTSLFPVVPTPGDQGARIVRLLEACSSHNAGIAVGGEVSLTNTVIDEVQAWLDASWTAPPLTVVGSIHKTVGSEPANLSLALCRRRQRLEHRKVVPFERSTSKSTQPVREGIVPGPRLIKVWVGGWARFSMLICRDLLDPAMRLAVSRAGVNLLAVPTYSDETSSYTVHVASISLATQGRVLLANNPTRFSGAVVNPVAVFGEPITNRSALPLTLEAESLGSGRGVGLSLLGRTAEWQEID